MPDKRHYDEKNEEFYPQSGAYLGILRKEIELMENNESAIQLTSFFYVKRFLSVCYRFFK